MTASNPHFRLDINGLRAWAVIAVVLYHFNAPGLGAGFIGVDVFFVISGYLMTGIVFKGLAGATAFSFIDFFLARARRIIPALWLLCAVLLAVGWQLLPALEYRALAEQIQAAAGFYSNYFFWQGAGYFDASSQEKWLLHTWSLGVEWQFYLLLPLALALLWRYCSPRGIGFCIVIASALSLLLACWLAAIKPSFSFYSLPTRAWEMLTGGLVYLYANNLKLSARLRKGFEWLGLLAIVSSALFFSTKTAWPSIATLLPVGGSALVLIAARQQSVFTNSAGAQFLGNISYSLYLWHWPIAVALHFAGLIDLWHWQLAGIALAIALAYLSYRFVEQPARLALSRCSKRANAILFISGFVLLAGFSYWVIKEDGVLQRVDARVDQILAERENKLADQSACLTRSPDKLIGCKFGGEQLGVIVMGDSHASALIENIAAALPQREQHALLWAASSCPPIIGVKHYSQKYRDNCGRIAQTAVEAQKSLPPAVPLLMVSRWSVYTAGTTEKDRRDEIGQASIFFDGGDQTDLQAQYREQLRQTVCEISRSRPVYLLRPLPEMPDHVPNQKARALLIWRQELVQTISLRSYYQRHAELIAAQDYAAASCGAKILDPLPYLCDSKLGICHSETAGLPIYSDDDHLNRRGGALLQPLFATMFQR